MKHLVIAEKPSVGRDIARVLHCNKKTNTYIEGTDYIVTWALGHLVTLADPEQYDEQYKTWNMDTLPMLPEHWKLVVIKQTGRQFHAVKELIFRCRQRRVTCGTLDPGQSRQSKTFETTLDLFRH